MAMRRTYAFILVSAMVLTLQPGIASASDPSVTTVNGPAGAKSYRIALGQATSYQILAGAALTFGATVLGADPDSSGVNGDAVADMSAVIAGIFALPGKVGTADLGGLTYTPGVYSSPAGAAIAVTGDVTLDAQGDSSAVFIFYTPAALNTTAGITVHLSNGAQAKNIYWVAGGAITTGASDILFGTFMSNAAITMGASTILTGRLLGAAAVTVGASSNFLNF
jgi:hypothetical protein